MKPVRRNRGNTLAFLDVMACGLGAVVLLFLIVKHNYNVEATSRDDFEEAIASQEQALSNLNQQTDALLDQIEMAALEKEKQSARADEISRSQQLRRLKENELAELQRQIEAETARKSALQDEIKGIKVANPTNVLEDPQVGEEEYLLGLKVEGKRIAVLIDRSASMTDELIVDIIVRKIKTDAEKRRGPKWQRTIRIARWLLNRLPAEGYVAVAAFNDQAALLNDGRWAANRNQSDLTRIFAEINDLTPTGPTNLQEGLSVFQSLSPAVSDVYLITDGLPTQSNSILGLNSGCRRNASTVSGKCRLNLFLNTISTSDLSSGVKVNVILLPLEGDPEAAPSYWAWTASTDGLLLAPAAGWP